MTIASTPIDAAPAPVPPTPPTTWSPTATAVYIGSLALFIIGTLTELGVAIPAKVTIDVQILAGVAAQSAALIATLVHHLANVGLKKTALKAGAAVSSVSAL
jgi:hypothetical protein